MKLSVRCERQLRNIPDKIKTEKTEEVCDVTFTTQLLEYRKVTPLLFRLYPVYQREVSRVPEPSVFFHLEVSEVLMKNEKRFHGLQFEVD